MTDQNDKPEEATVLCSDVDSNGIPILNDVVEEGDEIDQQLSEKYCATSTLTCADSTTSKPTSHPTEIDYLKEALRQELSDELNKLIQSALLITAEDISTRIEEVIENKLSDALQKQMGEMLKRALEERFKNNNSF